MKVVCIKKGKWLNVAGHVMHGPEYEEICEVEAETPHGHYYLVGYYVFTVEGRAYYSRERFRPLNDDELAQEAILNEAKEHIKETVSV